jgi:hypothetical protein
VRAQPIIKCLEGVGKSWTRQIKAEERSASARIRRSRMYERTYRSLKDVCYENMEAAWNKASDNNQLPTHLRQCFYVMRAICAEDLWVERDLLDSTFDGILKEYVDEWAPGWDILYGARGVFKEPHRAADDPGLPMSTINVRDYLRAGPPSGRLERLDLRRGESLRRGADLREGASTKRSRPRASRTVTTSR